jgi:hypothetical protein
MKCVKSSSPYVLFLAVLLMVSAAGMFFERTDKKLVNIDRNDAESYVASIQLMDNK